MRKGNKLNRLQSDNLVYDVCEYIVSGLSRTEIVEKVLEAYPKLTEINAVAVYEKSKEAIIEKVGVSLEGVINQHVNWYEVIWKKFNDIDCIAGKNAALRQKEKILGLLKEENIIKIDNEVNINVKKRVQYDFTKLDKDEQKRMDEYLKLVKLNV